MVELSTLRRAAVYGAVLSTSGCAFLYYQMQSRLSSGEFYTKSLEALRADERINRALGPPIRSLFLNLANKENFVTKDRAQLSIPVKGSKYKGHLHTRCSRSLESKRWIIESLELEVNTKVVPVKFTNKVDSEELAS